MNATPMIPTKSSLINLPNLTSVLPHILLFTLALHLRSVHLMVANIKLNIRVLCVQYVVCARLVRTGVD